MSIKRKATNATSNTATNAQAPARKASPAKAPAKASPAPARKAPAKTAPAQTAKAICECHVRLEALYGMTQTQQKQIEALTAQCETLERIIVAVQTANAQAPARETAPAPAKAEKAQPKASPAPAREALSIEDVSFDKVFDATLDAIEANANAGFLNEKVAQASPASMRRFLKTAQNRTIKLSAKAKGLTISALDAMLADKFE